MEDTINKAESLHKIETTTQKIGLFFNASKTKAMHFNPSVESHIHAMNGDALNFLEKVWNSHITTKMRAYTLFAGLQDFRL